MPLSGIDIKADISNLTAFLSAESLCREIFFVVIYIKTAFVVSNLHITAIPNLARFPDCIVNLRTELF